MSASAQPTFAGTRCLPIEDYFHRIPLVPWICPPLHPELLRLLENIGQEAVLAPGAQIYREGEPVSRFAVVKKGLVARKLGTYGAKSDNQIGLAGPGNIATGNLNIFSHRPAVGAYEAILPTSIVWCEHGSSSKSPDAIPISSCCSPLSANSQCSPTVLPSPVSRS